MRLITQVLTTICLFSLLIAGCSKKTASPVSPTPPILKVAVLADGRLMLNGEASSIDSLREALQRLSEQRGAVWYYREAGQKEPPPIAMEVMKAVVDMRLPIRLSSRPDFSDAVSLDGKPTPK